MHRHIAIMTNAANCPGEEPSKDQRFKDFAEPANDWFWEMDEALRFSYVSKICLSRALIQLISSAKPEKRSVPDFTTIAKTTMS